MTPEVGHEGAAYDAKVRIEKGRVDASFRWDPTHDFYVVFWRQPRLPESDLPAAGQEQVMWAAAEHSVHEAADVHEVIAWADQEARRRSAMYTLYAVTTVGVEQGLVWLAGVDPTRGLGRPNFEGRKPADVDPVSGTPAEVYRPE
jgi:hypothetical protein